MVKNIIKTFKYETRETILIGDSINDYEAARDNCIRFYGYNNPDLKKYNYINYFSEFKI